MSTFEPGTADVLVVGAGAAGMTAAAELGRAGLSVVILEARDRLGGRIFTWHGADNTPVELGAEFIHGFPSEIWEPLQARNVRITEVGGDQWCHRNGRMCDCEFFSQVETILNKMDAAAPDESFESFLEKCCPVSRASAQELEARERALAYVIGFNAANADRVGVHWLVEGMLAEEKIQGDRAFRAARGYDDLMEVFRNDLREAGVTVYANTIVEALDWRPGHVEVTARRTDEQVRIGAAKILITVPLGVLKSAAGRGGMRFSPALSAHKFEAMEKLEMGKVIRVTFRFRERFWDHISPPGESRTLADMSFLFSQDPWFPTWWTRMPERSPILTGWAPAHCAERLSGKDEAFVIDRGLQTLSELLNVGKEKLKGLLDAAYFHDWQSDPFSRGAYSYGAVGSDGAQKTLGDPLESTLFFAGEATDTSGHNGTVHGAIASGRRAAQEVLLTIQGVNRNRAS